jgi:hypothetical protein
MQAKSIGFCDLRASGPPGAAGGAVEVKFVRRELATSGGNSQQALQMQRHGRHRTHFGDAVSITILFEPTPPGAGDRTSSKPEDRDDDRDKIKKP